MSYVVLVVCVLIVLWHVFLVPPKWPDDPQPLAEVIDLDEYRSQRVSSRHGHE
jgi:hypothetical protein